MPEFMPVAGPPARSHSFPLYQIEVVNAEGENLNIPPNYLVKLEHEVRLQGAGNPVTFEFFDPDFGILDVLFTTAKQLNDLGQLKIRYRYGYSHDMSPWRQCAIIKHQPGEITRTGVAVTMEGIDEGVAETLLLPNAINQNVFFGNISDIIKMIADARGWVSEIEPTRNTANPETNQGTWIRGNMSDLEFIQHLSNHAVSFSGVPGRYVPRLVTDGLGITTLFFKPLGANNEVYKTYVFGHDRLGEVVRFSPEQDAVWAASLGATGLRFRSRDPLTREVSTKSTGPSTYTGDVALGKRGLVREGFVNTQILSANNDEGVEAALNAYYSELSKHLMRATMEIIGDWRPVPPQLINVLVQTPQGRRYFTSGTYRIAKATHVVQAGSFITTYELDKNAVDVGDITIVAPQATSASAG